MVELSPAEESYCDNLNMTSPTMLDNFGTPESKQSEFQPVWREQ